MAEEPKITEDQANEALRALIEGANAEPDAPVTVRKGLMAESKQPELPISQSAESPEPAPEPAPAETPAPAVEEPPKEPDDIAALKKRLDDQRSEYDAKVRAIQERYQHNERIVRERFLRKATATDKALKTLRAVKTTEGGIPVEDVDRTIQEIEATMNPASPSYQPPPAAIEDQSIILNDFLNEKGMTAKDSEEFGNWIRGEGATSLSAQEQALAGRDLDGFLRLAHVRYEQAKTKPTATRNAAVEAVRSVQRTQREAARAATATPAAPRKTGSAPQGIDMTKLTHDDISALLRQSVEQNH